MLLKVYQCKDENGKLYGFYITKELALKFKQTKENEFRNKGLNNFINIIEINVIETL